MNGPITEQLRKLSETLHADDMSLYVIRGGKSKSSIQIIATAHNRKVLNLKIPRGQGIVGWVAANGKSLICNDVHESDDFYGAVDMLTGYRTNSILAVPVKRQDDVIGVLEAINKTDGTAFTRHDEEIAIHFIASLLPFMQARNPGGMHS